MLDIQVGAEGTIRLVGRFDASQADKAEPIFKSIRMSAVADFTELDYISSAGIAIIVETYKRLLDAGHTFRLVNLNPRIRTVFGYAGLDKVMQID